MNIIAQDELDAELNMSSARSWNSVLLGRPVNESNRANSLMRACVIFRSVTSSNRTTAPPLDMGCNVKSSVRPFVVCRSSSSKASPPILKCNPSNSTVSQARIMRRLLHERVAARTSVERPGEGDGQSLSHGGDRVLDVALGSNRGRLGVLDDGEGQGLRGAGVLRGERPLSRGSGIHRRRCRAWRGDGILASLVLRNGRGRVRS